MSNAEETAADQYKDWIKNVAGAINTFRCNTTYLKEYADDQKTVRNVVKGKRTLNCWDDYDTLKTFGTSECCRLGGFYEEYSGQDASEKYKSFKEDIDFFTKGDDLYPLKWSDSLALSAAMYMRDISGCNVYQPNIIHDGRTNEYINMIADYHSHRRLVIYPERQMWRDAEELAFDLLLDDTVWTKQNLGYIMSEHTTHIGVSCNCHPTFEQFCVIELGEDVEVKDGPEHSHIFDSTTISMMQKEQLHFDLEHVEDIPIFHMPSTNCPSHRNMDQCAEFDDFYEFPEWKNDNSPATNTQQMAQRLFTTINEIRDDPSAWATSYTNIDAVIEELDTWSSEWDYLWSEAVARAAREVVNSKGSCGFSGNVYGDDVETTLRKYAYNWIDFQYIEVTGIDMKDDPIVAMEYILGQDCIDKEVFKTPGRQLHLGVGCACENDEEYTCIFGLARGIRQKEVVERIPDYQDYAGTCASKCPYGDNNKQPNPFFMYEQFTSIASCP